MQKIIIIIVSVFLGICSYTDIKTRQIPVWVLALFGGVGLLQYVTGEREIAEAAGCLPGIAVLGLSVCTAKIGLGDGWILAVLGLFLDFWRILETALIGMVLCSIAGILLLIWRKKEKEYQWPFAPFLLAAYWITWI